MANAYGRFYQLSPWNVVGTAPAFTAGALLDGSTDKQGWNFHADDAITITRLGIRINAIAGTTPTYRISLQGQSGGNPDGTIKGGGSPASATFNPSGSGWAANDWRWITLDNPYTCSAGEALSIVVDYSSGTINAGNNLTLTASVANNLSFTYPTPRQDTTGTWAKVASHGPPCMAYGSSSRAYGWPMETLTTTNFNTANSPDEYAVRFVVPTSECSTYKIQSVQWHGDVAAGIVVTATLYDGTTSIATGTLAGDAAGSSPANDTARIWFTSFPTLTAGNVYRIGIAGDNATTTTRIYRLGVDVNDDLQAYPGGDEIFMSTRTDAGAWTDVDNERIHIDVFLHDLTPPAAGGGGIFIPRRRIA